MIPWWHLAERRGMLGLEICGRGRARRTSQSSVSGCRRRRLQLWTSWRVVAAAVGRHCLGTLAFVIKTRAGRRGQDKPGLFRLRLRPWRGITWPHWSCKQNMVAVTDETKLEAHRIGRHYFFLRTNQHQPSAKRTGGRSERKTRSTGTQWGERGSDQWWMEQPCN
jgi:hypothetical protein